MFRPRFTTFRGVFEWSCIVILVAQAPARGQGSIAFNGTTTSGTSKLENATADVLRGSEDLTMCVWVYPEGQGETAGVAGGYVATLDETGNTGVKLYHSTSGANLTFQARFSPSNGTWTFPVTQNTWTAVAVRYNKSSVANQPIIRVNFATVTPTQAGPSGSPVGPFATGYCIGNSSDQTHTWDGRIAHVQVFNRQLSPSEMDGCLRSPGSILHGLQLWLPMTYASDTTDRSGFGLNGTGTALAAGSDGPVIENQYMYANTALTSGQIVMASNGTEPTMGVVGLGTRSKITANNSVLTSSTPLITNAFAGAGGVIEPSVTNVYLHGNKGVAGHPFNSANGEFSQAAGPNAIDIDGDAGTVTGCKIFDFRGDGIRIRNSTAQVSALVRMPRVERNKISHCWTGIRSSAVDTQVVGNRVANSRDYCLQITE
jgi:hypothetical protein